MNKRIILMVVAAAAAGILVSQSVPTFAIQREDNLQNPKNPPPVELAPRIDIDKALLARLHTERVEKFVAEDGFGMRRVMTMNAPTPIVLPTDKKGNVYDVKSLDLVGLKKDADPTVFVSAASRHAKKQKDAVKRAPDEFEAAAFKKLAEEEIVWQTSGKEIRMVGALRATEDCMSCHKAENGQIIGAFSYTLARQDPEKVRRERMLLRQMGLEGLNLETTE
jgi:hypothetical protein